MSDLNYLIGIPTHIANMIASIELWKAGIGAFWGELREPRRPREVLASVVGILAFSRGAQPGLRDRTLDNGTERHFFGLRGRRRLESGRALGLSVRRRNQWCGERSDRRTGR